MQPHVNLGYRFRTHFETIGFSNKRNLRAYNHIKKRLMVMVSLGRLSYKEYKARVGRLVKFRKHKVRIDKEYFLRKEK